MGMHTRVAAAPGAALSTGALHAEAWAERRCGSLIMAGAGGLRARVLEFRMLMALKEGARTRISVARAMARDAITNLAERNGVRQMAEFAMQGLEAWYGMVLSCWEPWS